MAAPKILIVDDEESSRFILEKLLQRESYEVFTASNGKEGLDLFRKYKPDVTILDLFMPIMDGFDFLWEIQPGSDDDFEIIPVTVHADDEEIMRCYEMGATRVLRKPFVLPEIRKIVKQSIESKRRARERRELEERLRRNESVYTELLDVQPNIICTLDNDFNIVYSNAALARICGDLDENAENKKFYELLVEKDRSPFRAALELLSVERPSGAMDAEIISSEGGAGFKINFAAKFGNDGSPLKYYVTAQQLDDPYRPESEEDYKKFLTRAEEELDCLRKELDSERYIKNEFIANVRHEIRTPLNSLIGMQELLRDTELNDKQREFTEIASVSAKALLQVIDNIFEYSNSIKGASETRNVRFHLKKVFDDLLKSVQLSANAKGLAIDALIAPDLPEFITGDSAKLMRILLHIIDNAIKFTEHGGVLLKAEKTGQASEGKGLEIVFSVTDTGPGIPSEKYLEIFKPFRQVENAFNRHFNGTGLGLAISGNIVRESGGRIWVESKEGHGSSFYFTMRFEEAQNF